MYHWTLCTALAQNRTKCPLEKTPVHFLLYALPSCAFLWLKRTKILSDCGQRGLVFSQCWVCFRFVYSVALFVHGCFFFTLLLSLLSILSWYILKNKSQDLSNQVYVTLISRVGVLLFLMGWKWKMLYLEKALRWREWEVAGDLFRGNTKTKHIY